MTRRLVALGAALLLTLPATFAHAELPGLQLSGFGTLGMVFTGQSDLRFTNFGIDQPDSDNPDFAPDSVLGVQANMMFSPSLSAVLQLVSRENPKGNYDPHASLAFLSYNVSEEATVRLGRMRIPLFMLSDSLNINFANPWIRPPAEVYGLNPFTDLNGIDLLYRTRLGSADLEIHPYMGTSSIAIYSSGSARLTRVLGVNLTLSTEQMTVFVGHGESPLTLHWGDDNFTLLESLMPPDVNDKLSGNDGYAAFSSAGFQWDDGQWLMIGEYAKRTASRYVNSGHGWHLTLGRRFGNIMPFVTIARQTQDRAVASASFANPLQTAVFEGFLVSRNGAQRSITLGSRWDFRRDAALKVEFSHIQSTGNSWGNSFFPHGDPALTDLTNRSVNMLGVALDVTF
ncbi:MAG: hypothetical protein RBT39_00435 [Azoarcus sp.]|jgi:hypothetical protein|nr:hypothetical protein [Azoarcus sp.]MDX9836015.1 hypothetical protein [Azoarcus sp.]